MVTAMPSPQEQFLTALRQWLDAFPTGVVIIEERQLPHCVEVRVTPRRDDAAKLTLEVMPYGQFDFYCGRGFVLEGLPLDIDVCLELIRAVSRGHLREKLWERHGRVRRNLSRLTTPTQTYVVRKVSSLFAWLASPVEREYAAWS
jgi:hypothetical protein